MYHVAKPTPDQLRWQDMELGVIIHYCMDIYNPDCKHIKNAEVATEIPRLSRAAHLLGIPTRLSSAGIGRTVRMSPRQS